MLLFRRGKQTNDFRNHNACSCIMILFVTALLLLMNCNAGLNTSVPVGDKLLTVINVCPVHSEMLNQCSCCNYNHESLIFVV